MFGVVDIWEYVLGAALITLLPGPNSMFTLFIAARCGVRAGYLAASGVFLGDTVLMTLAAAGLATLLRSHQAVLLLARCVGSAYLIYIGYTMLSEAWRRWLPRRGAAQATGKSPTAPTAAADKKTDMPFLRAVLISLLNPKMMLFFLSFFVQFVDPDYPRPALSFTFLGAVIQVFSAAYLSVLILSGAFLTHQFRRRRRLAAGALSIVGTVFIGFGVKLAATSLS